MIRLRIEAEQALIRLVLRAWYHLLGPAGGKIR